MGDQAHYGAALMAMPQTEAEWARRGYTIVEDMSGHIKGWEWAEMNGISDPDECGGNSQSFIEGCRAYASEQQQESNGATASWAGWVAGRFA